MTRSRHPAPLADPGTDRRGDVVTSRLVGVAVGVTMTTYKMVYEQAFALLRIASRRQHRPLGDVAQEVVTGANAVLADGGGTPGRALRARLRATLTPADDQSGV